MNKRIHLEEREHPSAQQRNTLRRKRKLDLSVKVRRLETAMKAYRMEIADLKNLNNYDMRRVIREDFRYNSLVTYLTNEEKGMQTEIVNLKKLHAKLIEHPEKTDFSEESDPDSDEDNKDPSSKINCFPKIEMKNLLGMTKLIGTTNSNTNETHIDDNLEVENDGSTEIEEEIELTVEPNDDYDKLNIIEEFEKELMELSDVGSTDEKHLELTDQTDFSDFSDLDLSSTDQSYKDYQEIDAQILLDDVENEPLTDEMEVLNTNIE